MGLEGRVNCESTLLYKGLSRHDKQLILMFIAVNFMEDDVLGGVLVLMWPLLFFGASTKLFPRSGV